MKKNHLKISIDIGFLQKIKWNFQKLGEFLIPSYNKNNLFSTKRHDKLPPSKKEISSLIDDFHLIVLK